MVKLIHYSFYLLFFVTPLLFFPWTFELFEFNKMMFVYLMTIIIATSWLAHAILTRSVPVRKTPLDIPILLFLASQVISTIYSINVHTSLIGYYSRFHGGLLSTISYILLYYAFVTFRPTVKTCVNLLLTSITLVSAYGIAEHFGIDKHMWVQDVQRRVFSTLGQPNWLAALLIMVLPISWAIWLKGTPGSPPTRLAGILSTTLYIALIYTKSRSGLLAFVIVNSVFWLLLFIKGNFPWRRFFILFFSFLLISWADGLSWTSIKFPSFNSPRQSLPTEAPYRGEGGTESGDIRKIVWKGALDIWRHYPYFGSGVETFAYSYYNFRPIEHNLVSEWDFLYNKAHNEYLNFLATTGAFGLGTYLLLQLWVFLWLLKKNSQLSIALFAALAGVSVSNFFGFSTVSVSLLFFLYPALAVVLTSPEPKKLKAISYKLSIPLIPLILASLFMIQLLAKWYLADINFASGKRYAESGYIAEAFSKLDRATGLLPGEPMYHNEFSVVASEVALAFHTKNATDSAEQAMKLALQESDLTRKLNPVHLNFLKTRARVMLTLSQINPIFLEEAKNTLLRGLELSPTDPKLMYNLALLYAQQNEPDKSLETLEKTIELKPNYEIARTSLAQMYLDRGDKAKAIEQYQYILNFIAPKNESVKQKLEELL